MGATSIQPAFCMCISVKNVYIKPSGVFKEVIINPGKIKGVRNTPLNSTTHLLTQNIQSRKTQKGGVKIKKFHPPKFKGSV